MRVAVLSDIHGNWSALLRVLDNAVQEGVTRVWCLGDVVGYGPHSLKCYEELRNLEGRRGISLGAWVAGNHDRGLAGRVPLNGSIFSQCAAWSLRQMKILASREREVQFRFDEMCEFLAALPTFAELRQAGVWLMHGWVTSNEHSEIDEQSNITGNNSYIYDTSDDIWKAERSWQTLSSLATDEKHRPRLILAGHTHQPLLWHRFDSNDWRSESPLEEACPSAGWPEGCPKCGRDGPCRSRKYWGQSDVSPDRPVLINPGSVGQPRDGCPAAAYVILDFEEHPARVTFKRVGYDVKETQDALAGLTKRADGKPDPGARDCIKELRTRLEKGE